jgi:ABC-type transport system involved in cytochrome c biogenesis permease subunit
MKTNERPLAGLGDLSRFFPWLMVLAVGLFLVCLAMPRRDPEGQMQLQEFGKLPVVSGGRVKPIDTVARNALYAISHKETFKDEKGKRQPAIKWLLDVMTSRKAEGAHPQTVKWLLAALTKRMLSGEEALSAKVFRIENLQVLNLLRLEPRPGFYRYSLAEFQDKIDLLDKEANRAIKLPEDDRDAFDQSVLRLARKVELYIKLAQLDDPLTVPNPGKEAGWESLPVALREMVAGLQAGRDQPAGREAQKVLAAFAGGQVADFFHSLAAYRKLPAEEREPRHEALLDQLAVLVAYAADKPELFNREVDVYRQFLDQQMPDQAQKARFEAFYNHFDPLFWCCWLYLVVTLMACLSWLGWAEPLRRAAFWVGLLLLAVHIWALMARMYILDRPFVFVTNLYSSALFIGSAGVGLGLILERIFRLGIGSAVGSFVGFLVLLLSPALAGEGDTLEMMQAVLDTNFWLATHVTVVTLGYMATMVAGLLGVAYLLLGVATPYLNRERAKTLSQMIYGILCFATFLSFTGTVLGGLWADYSWGRFWGWDPKENGAVLIVLWNALILHARWGGMVKQRGIAVLAAAGNMVVAWSWFGTNQLGRGLHAYGFDKTLAMVVTLTWIVHVAVIVLGLMPMQLWWSVRANKVAPAPLPPIRLKPVEGAGDRHVMA